MLREPAPWGGRRCFCLCTAAASNVLRLTRSGRLCCLLVCWRLFMVSRKTLLPIIIVFSILTLFVAPAQGGSVSAGGWNASWDKSFDDTLGLTALSSGDDTITFNKFAQFTKG